jgi:hypothetical protein
MRRAENRFRRAPEAPSLLNSNSVGSLKEHAELLRKAGVAGTHTSHGAEDNLYKIHAFLDGHSTYVFGMDHLPRTVGFEETYAAVAERTGYPPDAEVSPGRGCIDPTRTAAGLLAAGERIRAVAGSGGRLLFGTGHPGALLFFYLQLGYWAEGLGGDVLVLDGRERFGFSPDLEWVRHVAVLGDGASLYHTHSPQPMREALARAGRVDLVVADHGFAGAAIAADIPTVAIMDTNDPALAVASLRGADLTLVPMDDNRSQNSYLAALDVLTGVSGPG